MKAWAGRDVTKARARWRPLLPVPCCRCGKPVIPDPSQPYDGWQADHYPVPREMGGTETWPAHSLCNLSAGGRRGAQITNTRRAERATTGPTMPPERERRIRPRW